MAAVRDDDLRQCLQDRGLTWESVCHVTATRSLARMVLDTGDVGLPIATLIDLITAPGLPGDLKLPLDGFPGPSVLERELPNVYVTKVASWQQKAAGRRLRLGIRFDDLLREYVRSELRDPVLARIFVSSRRELWQTFQTLSAAGIHPLDLSPEDVVGEAAVAAWHHIERLMPEMAFMRDALWVDFKDFEMQSSDVAWDVLRRIEGALECAFGSKTDRRTIVHHGFHFFTPPQWALFQLLRRIPDVDQVFVIHDDGRNPAFEIWRRFHIEKWHMPSWEPSEQMSDDTVAAKGFSSALNGDAIDPAALSASLSVLACRSPADLVRQWRLEAASVPEGEEMPLLYAADAASVDRFVRRLGRQEDLGAADLAQLPIGAFLLAVHDCIRPRPTGDVVVTVTPQAITEMIASGYVEVAGLDASVSAYLPALKRALPFFRGCHDGASWAERAALLRRLIVETVDSHGARTHGVADVDRMQRAVDNPLRTVPWADLSAVDVEVVEKAILSCIAIVERIVSRERVELGSHLLFLRRELQKGMQELPEQDRQQIMSKIDGFSVDIVEEIDVEGLVDVVAMLVGRAAEFDVIGGDEDARGSVRELRSVDSLGMRRAERDVHITNLADGSFPSQVRAVGWPFRLDDLRGSRATVDPIVVEILQTREETAGLGDLYLLWLALDGVEEGHRLTLSWISDLGGELRNPSPLLTLLTQISATKAIAARAGGLPVQGVQQPFDAGVLAHRIEPSIFALADADLEQAVAKVDPRSAASALACPRRFAIQWAMGPSAAFQSEHHQAMLLGNVEGALVRRGLTDYEVAGDLCKEVWANLTVGERESSRAKRRVIPEGGVASAHPTWILTLGGKREGDGPIDLAYQGAKDRTSPETGTVVPPESVYLPPGVDDPAICNQCPVRQRCSVWVHWQDG